MLRRQRSSPSVPKAVLPHNPILAAAALHALGLALPVLLFSFAGALESYPLIWCFFNESHVTALSQGHDKVFLEMAMALVITIAIGYVRLFLDGAMQHPIVLVQGLVGKSAVSYLLLELWMAGLGRQGILWLAVLPDAVFIVYFLRIWQRLGFVFASSQLH